MQRSKVIKLIYSDKHLDADSETEYLVIVHKGVGRTRFSTSLGVRDAFNFTYRKDNVDLTEHFRIVLSGNHEEFYLKETNKWYDIDRPKEFEQLRNDLEAACTLALLEG